MKIITFIIFSLLFASHSFASNEERNLSLLLMNSSVKLHSFEKDLNGRILADELADSLQTKKSKKVKMRNTCEDPRVLLSDDNQEKMRFEDCTLVLQKKKGQTVSIQYQIKTKTKNGKTQSLLRKKTLKAHYL